MTTTTLTPMGAPTPIAAAASRRERDPYRHLEGRLVRLSVTSPDDPVRAALRNELALAFAPVCRNVTRRFGRQGESVEDLEQVAAIGMLKALDQFRLPPGFDPVSAFMGYALPKVTGEIQRHLRDHTWAVHVARPVKEIQSRLWCAVAELTLEHGRPPRPAELAARLHVDRDLVVEALHAGSARRPLSTDALAGSAGNALEPGAPDTGLADVDRRNELRAALRHLPDRSVRIIAMRFFDDLTQTQIARELGISQMHVSRLLTRSLATLRENLAA